jgi:hypothetical protein
MLQNFLRLVRNSENKSLTSLAFVLVIMFILACKCGDLGNTNRSNSNNSNNSNSGKTSATEPDNGDFKVISVPVKNPKYESLDKYVKDKRMLENAADGLNKSLTLPWDITIASKDCDGTINAYYNPQDRSITICYEFMELFQKLYLDQGKTPDEANQLMFDATTFIFCHELGHGLIDAYKLPVTGKEEDAVDQLATYISAEEMGEQGENAAQAGALGFYYLSEKRQLDDTAFADEHSMDKQRFYNIICWLYGHNPERYGNVVQNGTLPAARAQRCSEEYTKLSNAWKTQLRPFRKNP